MTDNNGALTDEFAYQPYGRMVAHSGATDTPFLFMGDYGVWHAGQGLYLTRHRAYDAHLMRFTSRDPIGIDGGNNLYVYTGNNPVAFVDPLGLWQVTVGVAYGIGGVVSFGENNGCWNISCAAGLGIGASVKVDPSDSSVYDVSSGTTASFGVEAQAEFHATQALDSSAQVTVSIEADSANNYSFGSTFAGAMQIVNMPVQLGGSIEVDVRGNVDAATIHPVVEVNSVTPSVALGGMVFSGIQGGVSWQASRPQK